MTKKVIVGDKGFFKEQVDLIENFEGHYNAVDHCLRKPKVAGSNPVGRDSFLNELSISARLFLLLLWPFLCPWHNSGRSSC